MELDGEIHEGIVTADTRNNALIAFCEPLDGDIDNPWAEPVHEVIVGRLRYYNTTEDPWRCEFKLKMIDEVTDEDMETLGIHQSHDELNCNVKDPRWHAARISYLIRNPELLDEPISIDCQCAGGNVYPIPEILDGWHRLFAHVYLGRERINATFGGLVELVEYLEGKTDECPEF